MLESRKKMLIVNNNMNIGGVQKALISLLDVLKDQYDITLLLFYAHGELMKEIPKGIRVVETKGLFRYVGMSQRDCVLMRNALCRGFIAAIAKTVGFEWSIRLMRLSNKKDRLGDFDVLISYLHCATRKSFYGGTAEYVLSYHGAGNKVCYIHCDYVDSGTVSPYSKGLYQKFDAIACVSESVKNRFVSVLPQMNERVYTIRNPLKCEDILKLSRREPYEYDASYLNCLTVARLSSEKGIDRFIRAIKGTASKAIRYYVVGEGKSRPLIKRVIEECSMQDQVFLLGESKNPYRYMVNADMLIVPSYHEAAPVVFQEALLLGLPVFTTKTLSAEEMIPASYGFVVENNEGAMEKMLHQIIQDREMISNCKQALMNYRYDETPFKEDLEELTRI